MPRLHLVSLASAAEPAPSAAAAAATDAQSAAEPAPSAAAESISSAAESISSAGFVRQALCWLRERCRRPYAVEHTLSIDVFWGCETGGRRSSCDVLLLRLP